MRGKNKCKILKQIRRKIAEENDIPFVTQECTFQGECKGTCPKCEAELRYLEQQLEKKQRLGKTVTVAALAASLMANLTACPSNQEQKNSDKAEGTFFAQATEPNSEEFDGTPSSGSSEKVTATEIELEGEPTESCEIIGEVESTEELTELEGDIIYIDPTEEIDWPVMGMMPISETDESEDDSAPIDIYESDE